MRENRHKPDTANFFWEGTITDYEVASINSFVRNGFSVNLWTYSQNSFAEISKEVEIKDASEILSIDLLNKLTQNLQKANYSSFSNLFRYKLLDVYGGWWFDTDCFCQKNVLEFEKIISNREYVLGLERENYVGSAVMYFTDTKLLKQIENKAYELIEENNYRLKWGQIGPDLITDVVISKKLIDNILDPTYFFPVPPNQIGKLFNPNIQENEKNEINNSFVCHTWNEMFRKYNINKNTYPPRNSYLFNQFHINNIEYTNERKIYSKLFMLRFNLVISIVFKLFSRIKVIIKNYRKQ